MNFNLKESPPPQEEFHTETSSSTPFEPILCRVIYQHICLFSNQFCWKPKHSSSCLLTEYKWISRWCIFTGLVMLKSCVSKPFDAGYNRLTTNEEITTISGTNCKYFMYFISATNFWCFIMFHLGTCCKYLFGNVQTLDVSRPSGWIDSILLINIDTWNFFFIFCCYLL